ncbi:MAG: hypothetical protein GF344_05575 [Chitinivibrionales bacterium]|nr:hypothetical protein [Chitinivibrionales bacterium]MBD3356439.1 hypothetical protein [Chitinivibrionales bacterium]
MQFLLKHKGVASLLLAIAAYLYFNPADRFGFVTDNIIVYDRIPIAFLDLYVNPDGRRYFFGDLRKNSDFNALCDSLSHLRPYIDGKPVTLLVGESFGSQAILSLSGERRCTGLPHSVRMKQLPVKAAVRLYNEFRSKGKPVAIVLVTKD